LNQGKKPGARRSARPKTHNRRVLCALRGTICGARRSGAAAPASGNGTVAFIVVPFPQQALSD
jgi:hypothetical protein